MDILKNYKDHLKADIDGMTAEQFYNFIAQFDEYSKSMQEPMFNLHAEEWYFTCDECRKENGHCESELHEDDPNYLESPCRKMFMKHCERGE